MAGPVGPEPVVQWSCRPQAQGKNRAGYPEVRALTWVLDVWGGGVVQGVLIWR